MKTSILFLRTLVFFFLLLISSNALPFENSELIPGDQKAAFSQTLNEAQFEFSDSRISLIRDFPVLKRAGCISHVANEILNYQERVEKCHYLNSQCLIPNFGSSEIIFPFHSFF